MIPDAGPPFQLVHEDDVATAFVAGTLGRGSPGPYNLAGRGTLQMSDVADALGWYALPLPDVAIDVTAEACSPTPPNDECDGAVVLDVNVTCVTTTGTVFGATESLPADSCMGFLGDANDDVSGGGDRLT